MKRLSPCMAAAAAAAFACLAAYAAEDVAIHQKGRVFSADTITVQKGQKITFVNDDTVPHNIMSTNEKNHFDLGSQRPGTAVPVAFDELGDVAVICAIHPRMHMTVKVVE